jgi:hypothetical protein
MYLAAWTCRGTISRRAIQVHHRLFSVSSEQPFKNYPPPSWPTLAMRKRSVVGNDNVPQRPIRQTPMRTPEDIRAEAIVMLRATSDLLEKELMSGPTLKPPTPHSPAANTSSTPKAVEGVSRPPQRGAERVDNIADADQPPTPRSPAANTTSMPKAAEPVRRPPQRGAERVDNIADADQPPTPRSPAANTTSMPKAAETLRRPPQRGPERVDNIADADRSSREWMQNSPERDRAESSGERLQNSPDKRRKQRRVDADLPREEPSALALKASTPHSVEETTRLQTEMNSRAQVARNLTPPVISVHIPTSSTRSGPPTPSPQPITPSGSADANPSNSSTALRSSNSIRDLMSSSLWPSLEDLCAMPPPNAPRSYLSAYLATSIDTLPPSEVATLLCHAADADPPIIVSVVST